MNKTFKLWRISHGVGQTMFLVPCHFAVQVSVEVMGGSITFTACTAWLVQAVPRPMYKAWVGAWSFPHSCLLSYYFIHSPYCLTNSFILLSLTQGSSREWRGRRGEQWARGRGGGGERASGSWKKEGETEGQGGDWIWNWNWTST